MPTLFTARFRLSAALASCVVAAVTLTAGQQPPAPQQNEVSTTITGDQANGAPRLAIPDFIALPPQGRTNTAPDNETVDAAKTIGRVLWDDLDLRARVRAHSSRRRGVGSRGDVAGRPSRSIAGASSTSTA